MNEETPLSRAWKERCARRIIELDSQLSDIDALGIAAEFEAFERTRVMAPEDAADFVMGVMTRTDPGRFERRARARAPASG
ncbi:MAG: hypothetical protein ABI281_04625 [Caldimonas sp.]